MEANTVFICHAGQIDSLPRNKHQRAWASRAGAGILFLAALLPGLGCSPSMSRDPAVLVADQFLEAVSAQDEDRARYFTPAGSDSEKSVQYLSQVFFMKKDMDQINSITFDPVKVDHGDSSSEVVFNQVLDGRVALDNVTVVVIPIDSEKKTWRVVDVRTRN